MVTEPTSLLQLKLQLSKSDLGKHDINMSLTSCCYRLVDFNDAKIQRCHMICDIFVFVRRRKSTLNSSKIFRLGRC